MNIVRRVIAATKALAVRWGGGRSWSWYGSGSSRFDYANRTRPGDNAVVAACVLWLARTFPEAPPRVRLRRRNGGLDQQADHPLTARLKNPNPYYSGDLLWMATLADWTINGNAYWAKVRDGLGRVIELWWLPATRCEPKFDDAPGAPFVSHYEFTSDGAPQRFRVEDVVHFRYGIDAENPRKGKSPMASLLREIYTDDEAANFSAALLRNLGVPGVVIAPDSDDVTPSQDEVERTKTEFAARFGGDNRGAPLVMSGKTKVSVLSFSPEQMNLRSLRGIPEERISAVLGIPAAVVGLGAGLANTKVGATMAEMREAAYESNLIPTQRLFAADITTQLLPDFGDPARLVFDFDLSQVRVLQDDQDALWTRLNVGVTGGWLTPNEAREKAGFDPVPDGDVLYVPTSVTPTDPAALQPPEPGPVPPALAEPTPMHALPPPATRARRPRTKAAGRDLAAAVTRLRERSSARLAREVAAGLHRERDAALARLGMKDTRDVPDPSAWLGRLLETWYRRVLQTVQAATEDALDTPVDLTDQIVRAYLTDAGANVAGITETTRRAVAEALAAGHAAGEGIPEIARRIRDLPAFGQARAETIARTELGTAANLASLTVFRASGVVVGVEILDGEGCGLHTHDGDPKADGMRLSLDEMAGVPHLAHPRCVRAFAPIVDAAELDGAA